MGYEEAFAALSSGDYRRAAPLLEKAAAETGYRSDMINHACTLALHRANEFSRVADTAFRVGMATVADDPASAMDYFQRAVQAGLDPTRVRQIGEIFEEWAGERRPGRLRGKISRVGHVIGSMAPESQPTRNIRNLTVSLKAQGIESLVFATECSSGWFWNPIPAPGGDGDFIERSDRIVEAIRESGLQLVFYHADLSDQIAARVASQQPAPVQVSVSDGVEMAADLFDGFIHLSQNGLERTRFRHHPAMWIPPSSDVADRLRSSTFENRTSLGIASAETVSASFSSSSRGHAEFVKMMIELLKRFPLHYHFLAGAADVRAVRGALHAEGVLPRLRFLGGEANAAPLLGVVDVYLAPFPDSGRLSVLDMMGAGKPVVAMSHATNSEFNTAAELVGDRGLTPRTSAEYLAIADKLLRDTEARERWGNAMHGRSTQEFSGEKLGARYLQFLEQLGSEA